MEEKFTNPTIVQYLEGRMTSEETSAFEAKIAREKELALEVSFYEALPQRRDAALREKMRAARKRPTFYWGRFAKIAAVSAGLLLPAVGPLARLVGPAGVLNLWISSVADLMSHLTAGISTWSAFASVGRVFGRALALPPFLAILALNAALALAAFRGLVALSSKRSSSHAGIAALSV